MKFIKLASTLFAIFAVITTSAKNTVNKETHVFSIVNNDTLRLDRYYSPDTISHNALIFAFGGGFKGGERDHKNYIPFFEYLAENGVNVVSVDYRTTLKNVSLSKLSTIVGFKDAMQEAVSTAVTDLFKATGYVLANCNAWGIDPTKIVACGSSAGAITVLQAEYVLAGGEIKGVFPDWFNYAGVVSFAGAICTNGEPVFTDKISPLMLFHGDADRVVPYEKAVIKNIGLWGSKTISNKLDEKDIPHIFHVVKGASHEICRNPMNENRHEILKFINDVTIGNGIKNITIITDRNPAVHEYETQFTIKDYLKANM